MSVRNLFRRSSFLARVNRRVRNALSGPGWGAFHHDAIYQGLIIDLIGALNPSSFVETGTFRGYSTELIAVKYPQLPIFTCEVVKASYQLASAALERYPNVKSYLGSSDEWIGGLLDQKQVGGFPIFFLDAHWQHYWPLRAELERIGKSGIKSVIVIDDFEVPAQEQFGFDIDGGGELVAGLKCNLAYIAPSLAPSARYQAIFPKYSHQDAFGGAKEGMLRGHIVLFQNAPEAYETFIARPFCTSYYLGHGNLQPAVESGPSKQDTRRDIVK